MPSKVAHLTNLAFGQGAIGSAFPLENQTERDAFAEALGKSTRPLTKHNTADCVDERRTLRLGDGMEDPAVLNGRIVAQVPGGLFLFVTKAAVAADLAVVRNAADFTQAYLAVAELMEALGIEDGGHGDCGASKGVERSVANEIDQAALLATLPALTATDEQTVNILAKNRITKSKRLSDGFYGNWNNEWHEAYLSQNYPQNFSILAVDYQDSETHGHHGSAVYVIRRAGVGFAKNTFIDDTGYEAFAHTTSVSDTLTELIISHIGGTREERVRLRPEFAVDGPQVLNNLVVKGFSVFADEV